MLPPKTGSLKSQLPINWVAIARPSLASYGETRGWILNRTPIAECPNGVDNKERISEGEIDLGEGAKGSGYLLTLVERKTAFTLIGGLPKATAPQVNSLTAERITPLQKPWAHNHLRQR